jgi:hypothetical protein
VTPYKTKINPLAGTSWGEVAPVARAILRTLAKRTKRQPYIRSKYFNKQKIFFTYFWSHLSRKPLPEQLRRLKYLPCALDLIQNSHFTPTTKENAERPGELLHRFTGLTPNGKLFFVQIKETKRSGKKEFMSVFSNNHR